MATTLATCPIEFSNSTSVQHQIRRLSSEQLVELRDFLIENEVDTINELSSKYVLELTLKEIERA